MNQNESVPDAQGLDTSPTLSDVGSFKSSRTETKYQDQTHWNSILDIITELKEDFGESDEAKLLQFTPEPLPADSSDPPFLYGCKRCSKDEILAAVPSREFTDCLVSQYFELLELSSC